MASNKSKTPGPIQVVVVLMLTVLAFYFGNRFGQVFDFNTMEITDGALATVNSIVAAPAAISMASVPMLYAIGLAITVLIVWLYTFMYAGNYRYGEEAGSAKWGTLKEGIAFKDQTDPSNNLLFTKNYGLALKKPKFDLEHDRNLNVMVIGGSGSGKTRNYVKPNLMQLNASYFLTDPKGTSLSECGYLFRDNGYRIKVFNTIEFNKSMHYNPLKYVKTDADILSFVNCLISNTNGDKQSGGDPFWENSERLLYTALIALLRDWFPPEDYSLDGLLTLLSMAEAKENDENFKSPLDMIFDEIETGKVYERNPFYQGPSTSSSYADAESDRMAISENTTDEFTWQSSLMERNNDGLSPVLKFGPETYKSFIPGTGCMTKIEDVKTERDCGAMCPEGLIPDAVALLSHADTEIWVAIEFRVSHPKTIEDARKYATVDFPVMEISITDDIANAEDTRKSLAERITGTGHATRFAGREWLYSPAAKKILKRSWHIEAEPSAKPLRHKGTDLIRLETPLPAITVYAVKGAPTGETSWDNIDLTLREISEATVEKQEEALRKKRSLSSRCPSYKNSAPAGRQIKQTKDTGFETPTKPHGILGRLKGLFDKFRK